MLLIFVPPASILVLPASADSTGPSTVWHCPSGNFPNNYDVTIVQGSGTIPGQVNGNTVTFAPNSSNKLIGADDIRNAVSTVPGSAMVIIKFPSTTARLPTLFVSPDPGPPYPSYLVNLTPYNASIQITGGGKLILAGSLAVAPNQTISIDADSIDQIVCPQMQSISANNCPESSSTPAVIFGGTLDIKGVTSGVGESSCPHGQVITNDITTVSLTVANAPPPPPSPSIRVCLNVNDQPGTGNVQTTYNIGAYRRVFVRLNGYNAVNPSGTIGPNAQLFIGGGTPLCY